MQPSWEPLWERKEEGKMVLGTRIRGKWTEWVYDGASLMKQKAERHLLRIRPWQIYLNHLS